MVMDSPDEVPEPSFFDDRIGPLEDAIVEAALEYEQAWTKYAHRTRNQSPTPDMMITKARAHQALLEAIRAYRDLLIEENN